MSSLCSCQVPIWIQTFIVVFVLSLSTLCHLLSQCLLGKCSLLTGMREICKRKKTYFILTLHSSSVLYTDIKGQQNYQFSIKPSSTKWTFDHLKQQPSSNDFLQIKKVLKREILDFIIQYLYYSDFHFFINCVCYQIILSLSEPFYCSIDFIYYHITRNTKTKKNR